MTLNRTFFRRPHGVGSSLNIWMFTPRSLLRHVRTLITEPAYFYDRAKVMIFQITHPGTPWLTQQAIRFLGENLRPEMHGFEWGSGRSTVWLASRVKRMVSVEHDPQWYEAIRRKLAALQLSVDYRLVSKDKLDDYVGQIAEFPDGFFDFALIDGESREGCLRAVARKVRRGGFVILDNADYEFDTSSLSDYDYQPTCNGVWRTDIFVRRDKIDNAQPSASGSVRKP